MAPHEDPITSAVEQARAALAQVDVDDPAAALPHLREAAESVTDAIDEAMAAAVLHQGLTIRTAGELAGLSENAVGPRLARTSQLAAYAPAPPPPAAPAAPVPLSALEAPAFEVAAPAAAPRGTAKPRITARAIERARYDVEQGRHVVADDEQSRPPMRFKPRR